MAATAADAFLAALDRLIAIEENEQQKSALRKLRSAAARVAEQALAHAVVVGGQAVLDHY